MDIDGLILFKGIKSTSYNCEAYANRKGCRLLAKS